MPQIERVQPSMRSPADRRAVEWLLALAYAALLVAVVWKLDHGEWPRDATPAPTVTGAVARAEALMLGFTESLRRPDRDAAALDRRQAVPEGWPLWSAEPGAEQRAANAVPSR